MGFAQLAADAGALGVGAALGGNGGGTGAGGREALLVLLEGGGQCCQSAGLPFDRDRLLLAAGRERSVVLVVLLQDLLEPGGFGLLGGDGLHRGGRLVLGGLGVLDAQPAGELESLLVLAAGQGEALAGALVGGISDASLLLGGLDRLRVDVVGPGLGGFGVSGGTADGAWVPLGETVGQLGGQPGIAAPALLGLVNGGAVGRIPGRGGGGLGGGHVRGQAGGGAGLLEAPGRLGGGGPGVGEPLGTLACGVTLGDQAGAGLGPGGDLLIELGQSRALLLEGRATGGQGFFTIRQALLELDECGQGAGPGGRLLDRVGQVLERVGTFGELDQLRVGLAVPLELGEASLLPVGLGAAGLVAAGDRAGDGLGETVAVQAGAGGCGVLRLCGQPCGELVELTAAVDALQPDRGRIGRGAGLALAGAGGLRAGGGLLGGSGGLVADLLEAVGELVEAPVLGVTLESGTHLFVLEGAGFEEAGQRPVERRGGGVDLLRGIAAHLLELLLDVFVDLGAEDSLQHALPLPGAGTQEAGELVLGQQHGLGELGAREAHGSGDLAPHLVEAAGDRSEPGALAGGVLERLGDQVRAAQAPQQRLGLLLDERVAAAGGAPLARPEVLRGAQHPVETVAGLEDQVDQALGPGIGELGADPVPAGAVPGHAAVQRVHDRIQDGGFPRSRRPFEQEHAAGAERGEVDLDLVAEGADAAQTQVVEFHEASVLSARTAW